MVRGRGAAARAAGDVTPLGRGMFAARAFPVGYLGRQCILVRVVEEVGGIPDDSVLEEEQWD